MVDMANGSICAADEDSGKLVEVSTTGGQPAGLVFDSRGVAHVADLAMGAIMHLGDVDVAGSASASASASTATAESIFENDKATWVTSVVEYEGDPLKGPSALAFDSSGVMYFVDSGPLGECTLESPRGSVFCVAGFGRGKYLKPLLLQSLAHPSGVAVGKTDAVVFVTELLANRVLRLVQRPAGVYHASVFHQFSGRMGPSAIVCDRRRGGLLYVARFDTKEAAETGVVSVLSPTGEHLRDIEIPGPEVTGVCLSPGSDALYVTEAATGAVYCIDL